MSANIFTTVAIAFILSALYFYLRKESFVNVPEKSIQFLSANETYSFLIEDPDFYIANLSPTDLYARKVKLAADYKHRAANSAISFTQDQMLRFSDAAVKADKFFSSLYIKGVDCAKIATIPWCIAMTQGSIYEGGLPHTRAGTIFVSSDIDETPESLLRVLVHEKVHIYTRLYPEEIAYYLESNGYIKWKQRMGVPRIRSNPDLDAWIYIEPKSESPMVAYYSSDRPKAIGDIVLSHPSAEHPFELLAYFIEAKLS